MQELGVVTIAQNSTVDYVRLAYHQCLSLRRTNPGLPYAVITDSETDKDISDLVRQEFDHVVVMNHDRAENQIWKLANESQLFHLTPFRETIKVESDLLFTANISHWWQALRYRNAVISKGCVDHLGRTATSRRNRQAFDANQLPDLYTGLMYWRRCVESQNLFSVVRNIQDNWDELKKEFVLVGELETLEYPSTDLAFAIAVKLLGEELYTLPVSWFRMAHMKPDICQLPTSSAWHKQLVHDVNKQGMIIAGHQQRYPVHYHDKEWEPSHV